MRLVATILLMFFLSGCSGEYILTAPDVVCPAGEKAALIFRLQRREFWRITSPQKNATVMVHLPDGATRCALTDKNGYAAVAFVVPSRSGVYQVRFYYQDVEGQELSAKGNVYSLSKDDRFVVVDMDSLPKSGLDLSSACLALKRLSQNVHLIYVSEKLGYTPAAARGLLRMRGYPEGPVVCFNKIPQWYQYRLCRQGWRVRAVKPTRTDDNLTHLYNRLKKPTYAITADDLTARTFLNIGMKVIFVGKDSVGEAMTVDSWKEVGNLPVLDTKNTPAANQDGPK